MIVLIFIIFTLIHIVVALIVSTTYSISKDKTKRRFALYYFISIVLSLLATIYII